jgi:hypothetical protein
VLTWQRPWPRSPPGLREDTDLHRLDEDLVRVVCETLQLDAAGAFLFSYLLKAKPDGYRLSGVAIELDRVLGWKLELSD